MAGKRKALPKTVKLRTKDKSKDRVFEIPVALNLLGLPNSAWEINDDNYIYSGNDIKRRPSKRTDSKPEE